MSLIRGKWSEAIFVSSDNKPYAVSSLSDIANVLNKQSNVIFEETLCSIKVVQISRWCLKNRMLTASPAQVKNIDQQAV